MESLTLIQFMCFNSVSVLYLSQNWWQFLLLVREILFIAFFLKTRDLDYSTTYSNRKNRPQKKVSVDNVNLCRGKGSLAILVTILQTATQNFSSVQSHLNQTKETNVTALCKQQHLEISPQSTISSLGKCQFIKRETIWGN